MHSRRYSNTVLLTSTLVYLVSSLDQSLMALMAEPIKLDLRLSDSQLGALTGLAFGLLFSIMGLPAAHWADRGNRATITALALGVWGIAVSACLVVAGFVQLALARALAAIGAASCMPPTYSLIGDYFPNPADRPRAMAVYMLSGPVGALISYTVGGWVSQHYGWRTGFFVMGLPGLALAFAVPAIIRDPRPPREPQIAKSSSPGMLRVLHFLWTQRSARYLGLAFVIFLTLTGGMASWFAVFLIRNHHMPADSLGIWFGLIFGASGALGVIFGGAVSGRWFGEDERTQMRLCSAFIASLIAFYAAFLLLADTRLVLLALFLLILAGNFVVGPTFALLQRLVPEDIRARSMAWIMLAANLVGVALGPELIGTLSDLMAPQLGENSLRFAMLSVSSLALWSAYYFWHVSGTVKADLRAVEGPSDQVDMCSVPTDRLLCEQSRITPKDLDPSF